MELIPILAAVCAMCHLSWGHGGHHDGKPLEFSSEIHNKDHIIEHLQRQISTKPKDQMTDEELEFHYFKLHDYDNNNKLDGVEIGKALTHFHDDGSDDSKDGKAKEKKEHPIKSDEIMAVSIDAALSAFDTDKDGYIEYFEFKSKSKQNTKS